MERTPPMKPRDVILSQIRHQETDPVPYTLSFEGDVEIGSARPRQAGDLPLLRQRMGKGGGFILAPAKSPQPGTPSENAVAVVEAFASGAPVL